MFDRHNYHTFQPLLYQVATAGLEPDSIAGPLRKLLEKGRGFYFRMAKVTGIHPEQNYISTEIGNLEYDYLVLATGSKTNYFGHEEKFTKAFPLKQVPQALDLRSHILQNFEKATITASPTERQRLLNMVIVGGGPTGVEVAGALGELKKHVLPKDYPDVDFSQMNITLIEGLPRLLNGMSTKSGQKSLAYLQKLGVEVKLSTMVNSFDGKTVQLGDDTTIISSTLIWAAGVRGNVIPGLKAEAVERSRVRVDRMNRVEGYENIFAIGDLAHMETEDYPKGHPMLAPVAIQQGRLLAANLERLKNGQEMKPFKYLDKGSMATIGRNKAVADLPGGLNLGGFMAWLTWMFVHLIYIIGFRNKIVVFSNWAWNYFTYDRGTRLIIRPFIPSEKPTNKE